MRRCSRCGRTGEGYVVRYMRRFLCRDCFIDFFEKKVRNTVLKHGMLRGVKAVGVAVSGGKDSTALLRALSKLFPDTPLKALHINLGIPGYSDECEKTARGLCEELGVECVVYDLKRREGFGVPDLAETPVGKRICGACGTVKRYVLNKLALEEGVDRVATGHNLDDVVEALFEFYLRGSVEDLVRIRPVSWSNHPKMVHRIKPLIEMTDEEDLYYALATGTRFADATCPLAQGSRILERKKLLWMMEEQVPGFKHTFYKSHVKRLLPRLEKTVKPPELRECAVCGMPSTREVCSYCRMVSRLERALAGR